MDFGCGFWVRTLGADFGCGFLVQIFQLGVGADFERFFLRRRRQTAEPCILLKLSHQNPHPKFGTPEEVFGKRLNASRHAKGSEASSWVGAPSCQGCWT